jgi:5-methylcytosine-specific restriction enzyme A
VTIPETTRARILDAVHEFDRDLRHAPEWEGWQDNGNYDWALVDQGKEYPVKHIIHMATGYPKTEFSGGPTANGYIRRLGFTVRRLGGEASPTNGAPGRRNPPWAWDELILALELYLRAGLLDDKHPEVMELSRVLNELPLHTVRPDAEKFRNPNGVALKLANFAAIDPAYPGTGLTGSGKRDREVWNRYADDTDTLAGLAADLRAAASGAAPVPAIPEEDEDEVEEGRIKFREHRARERNARIIKERKRRALTKHGCLTCEVCEFDFVRTYGELGYGFIECHHVIPLSASGVTTTTSKDLALVCPNCHRMLHRPRPWLSLPQLRALREEHLGAA